MYLCFHYTGGARAWMRHALLYMPCVHQRCVSCTVAFAACVNADKYSVMFLISLHWLCMGMDEARALVHTLCSNSVSRVPWPLLHASMLTNVFLCP